MTDDTDRHQDLRDESFFGQQLSAADRRAQAAAAQPLVRDDVPGPNAHLQRSNGVVVADGITMTQAADRPREDVESPSTRLRRLYGTR